MNTQTTCGTTTQDQDLQLPTVLKAHVKNKEGRIIFRTRSYFKNRRTWKRMNDPKRLERNT